MTTFSHRRRVLAEHGSVRVERCACGQIIVHVGFVSLTLSEDSLPQLVGVLQEAINAERSDAERVDLFRLSEYNTPLDEQLH